MTKTATQTIPKGYKQTEIDVIPEDWDVKKLDDLVHFNNGKAHEQFITENGNYIVINSKFISTEGEVFKTSGKNLSPLSRGEITMVMSDIPNGKALAKCFFIRENDRYTLNQRICSFKSKGADSEYLFYKLNRNKYFLDFDSGVGQTNLKRSDILNCPVVIPIKKEEQTVIATVLSETDAQVEKLEKLIGKKRAIKQGAMQALLTGKKRLPGFSDEWEEKPLYEIGKTYGGISGKVKSDFGHGGARYIPFMNIMSNPIIDTNYFEKVDISPSENQARVKKGDLFFNGSSETPEEVGMCSVLQENIPNLYLNSFCFGLRLNKDLSTDGLWLSYFFRSGAGRELIFSLAQGATRYNLSKTNFLKLEIPYPDPKEQTAIANVISDMDAEINALEKSLEKYRQIKIGMMQNLLTGKIRLIKN